MIFCMIFENRQQMTGIIFYAFSYKVAWLFLGYKGNTLTSKICKMGIEISRYTACKFALVYTEALLAK